MSLLDTDSSLTRLVRNLVSLAVIRGPLIYYNFTFPIRLIVKIGL
jgi:hypothetical protein